MYVCAWMYLCACVRVFELANVCAFVYMFVRTCVYSCMCVCLSVCAWVGVCVRVYCHARTHTNSRMKKQSYKQTELMGHDHNVSTYSHRSVNAWGVVNFASTV